MTSPGCDWITRRPLAFALLAMPLLAEAQLNVPSMPPLGSRVRLDTRAVIGRRITGPLTVMNQGFVSVAIDPDGAPTSQISVPWSGIYDISYSRGADVRRGVATGILLGLGASIIAYPALNQTDSPSDSRLGPTLLSFGLLPVTGAVVGAFHGPERWEALDWRPTIDTVMPEGEVTRLRLATETQVKALVDSRWIKARVLATTDDSLIVQRDSKREAFSWGSVSAMNMRARRSRIRGAALGLTLMGVFSVATAAASPADSRIDASDGALGLVAGAGIGALIGAPMWNRVPIPIR